MNRPSRGPGRQPDLVKRFPTAVEDHQNVMSRALTDITVNPDYLVWHYVRAAIVKHGGITQAARAMSMHRRTLQRIVAKKCPLEHPMLGQTAFHQLKKAPRDEA